MRRVTSTQNPVSRRQELLPTFLQFPLDNELVVVRRDVEGLFLLNPAARLLWQELSGGASVEETVQAFVRAFQVPEFVARRDISATLTDWSEGLLRPETAYKESKPPSSFPEWAGSASAAAVEMNCLLNDRMFRVILEGLDLVEEITPRLAGIATPVLPEGPPCYTFRVRHRGEHVLLFRDQVCIAKEDTTSAARALLLQEMTQWCAPERKMRAILHAGACGTESAAILLAGASHAGKSTICAALMAEGFYCYSDDSAMLDCNFRVAGMPFPIMLRPSSWPVLASRSGCMENASVHRRAGMESGFLPSNLPGNKSPAAPVKALVFVEYTQARVQLETLTIYETLLVLQQSGFWVEHDRENISEFLLWLQGLPRHKLIYSSIDDAVGVVRGLLG